MSYILSSLCNSVCLKTEYRCLGANAPVPHLSILSMNNLHQSETAVFSPLLLFCFRDIVSPEIILSHNLRSRSAGTQCRKSHKCTSAISIFVVPLRFNNAVKSRAKTSRLRGKYIGRRQ